jgi:hypothetical protein
MSDRAKRAIRDGRGGDGGVKYVGWLLSSVLILAVVFTALVMLHRPGPARKDPDRVVIVPAGPHGGPRECVQTERVRCLNPAL